MSKQSKYSFGLACCSYNARGEPQILLVKKTTSYGLGEMFRYSNYSVRDTNRLKYYFERMTNQEKIWIANQQFDIIYACVHGRYNSSSNHYMMAKVKFNSLFLPDKGHIMDLLDNSSSVSEIWEIPKGRKNRGELDIECAQREFREETSIPDKLYMILPPIGKFSESIETNRSYYYHSYFVAYMSKPIKPRIRISNRRQTKEVSDVQWFTLRELGILDKKNQRVYPLAKKILKSFKRRISRNGLRNIIIQEVIEHSQKIKD
jgi:8-oxo-dGTP pyrophosphatase MutT (NUDIX family)